MTRTEHREEKWIFPFIEYAPLNSSEKLPLIVQLHGAGERGAGNEDLIDIEINGFSKMFQKNEYECLLIMPQCPLNTFWAARVESVLKFIEQICQAYNVDKDRIYLTGLSMGGYGTWYTAMAKPDMFAAIAPICGGGMAWNAGVLNMPVWVFHGTDDVLVSVTQSDEMVKGIKNNGGIVKYTRLDGVGHNAWDYAYNETLLNWFLDKKK